MVARVRTDGEVDPADRDMPDAPKEAEVVIDAGATAKPVIARVIAIAATRAGFSLDRMSDGVLVGDAIAAAKPDDFADGRVGNRDRGVRPKPVPAGRPVPGRRRGQALGSDGAPGTRRFGHEARRQVEIVEDETGEYLAIEIAPEPAVSA